MVKWHRFNGGDYNHLWNGGYRSADNRWLIIRVSNGQAQVWEAVNEDQVCSEENSLPWLIDDVFALVSKVDNQWFAHRWDSVNIGDAKAEVSQSVEY